MSNFRDSEYHFNRDSILTISAFTLTISLSFIFSYSYARLGFENPLSSVFRLVGMGGLIFGLPAIIYILTGRVGSWRGPWLLSHPAIVLLLVLLLGGLGWLSIKIDRDLFLIPAWIGVLCIAVIYGLWLMRRHWLHSIALLLFSILLVGGLMDQRHPRLLPEMLVSKGGDIDNVYHAAYSNMLVTYGRASTGLDGLPYTPNHYFSHWLFGHLAVLVKVDIVTFYMLCYPAIFAALTLMSFAVFAGVIRSIYADPERRLPLHSDWLFWLLLFIGIYGVISPEQQQALYMDPPRLFRSESLSLGFSFTLLIAGLLVIAYDSNNGDLGRITPGNILLVLIVMPLLCILLGLTKMSELALGMVVIGWLWLRLEMFRRPLLVLAVPINLIVIALIYQHISVSDPTYSWIEAFHFFRVRVSDTGKPTLFLFYFLWSWIVVFLNLRRANVRSLGNLWSALRERKLIMTEIVVIASLGGFGVVSILAFADGSPRLFMGYQGWLALALVMAYAVDIRNMLPPLSINEGRRNLSHLSLAWIAALLIGGMFIWQTIANMQQRIDARNSVESDVRALVGDYQPDLLEAVLKEIRDYKFDLFPQPAQFSAVIASQPWWPIEQAFREIAALPHSVKQTSALFIPRENELYWNHRACNEIPFYGPALTGLAMVDGLPMQDCRAARFYSYGIYTLPEHPTLSINNTVQLCDAAVEHGFSRVEIVKTQGDLVIRESLECEKVS